MWEGNMGKGWERHCIFIMIFINLPLETHLSWWTVYMLFIKTLICFGNDFSRPSFISDANRLWFLLMLETASQIVTNFESWHKSPCTLSEKKRHRSGTNFKVAKSSAWILGNDKIKAAWAGLPTLPCISASLNNL